MPSPGLQIFGSGLRLQQQTPGLTDTGNAHISGMFWMDAGAYPNDIKPNAGQADSQRNISIGIGRNISWGAQGDDICTCVWIGNNQTVETNPNGNNSGSGVLIGHAASTKDPAGIVIGGGAFSGSSANYPGSSAYNVVVGQNASATGWYGSAQPGDTCIGAFSKSGGNNTQASPANPNTLLGGACKATNFGVNGGQCLVVGAHNTTNFKNSIIIKQSTPGAPYAGTQDNQLKIGEPSHTLVELGPMTFNKPTITGAKGGNAALADLLTKLAAMNLIVDSTT